jgi:hypothetical protein
MSFKVKNVRYADKLLLLLKYLFNRINLDRKSGGLGGLKYPLLSDFHKKISKDYDVLIESEGIALRGSF